MRILGKEIKVSRTDIFGWVIFGGLIVALFLYVDPIKKIPFPNRQTGKITPVVTTGSAAEAAAAKVGKYPYAREIVNPAGFINTDGIKIQDLIGKKVILLDIWTYSCINCQRTLPYITSWYKKYKDQGLEIIGIHTPEFGFEKIKSNVEWAVEKWGIEYPVVMDNDYGTWQAYTNRYWPHKYLIDIDGYIVYDHIGEGSYDQTEQKIQELLAERMERLGQQASISGGIVEPDNVEKLKFGLPFSPEIYFGAWRNSLLANGRTGKEGIQTFVLPEEIKADKLYFSGTWDIQTQFAENINSPARIVFKYKAEKVFLVAAADSDLQLTILRDGQPVGEAAGVDVIDGTVIVNQERLYRLIEDPKGYGVHTLEIIIESPGLKTFAFTFG